MDAEQIADLEAEIARLRGILSRLARRARGGVMTHEDMDEVHNICDEAHSLGVDVYGR